MNYSRLIANWILWQLHLRWVARLHANKENSKQQQQQQIMSSHLLKHLQCIVCVSLFALTHICVTLLHTHMSTSAFEWYNNGVVLVLVFLFKFFGWAFNLLHGSFSIRCHSRSHFGLHILLTCRRSNWSHFISAECSLRCVGVGSKYTYKCNAMQTVQSIFLL